LFDVENMPPNKNQHHPQNIEQCHQIAASDSVDNNTPLMNLNFFKMIPENRTSATLFQIFPLTI
jgi:hypothetical protein